MSRTSSRAWRDGRLVADGYPLSDLDTWRADPSVLIWVDLLAPDRAELDQLAAELGLDPLAVEDAIEPGERPKATRHAGHTFITCYATRLLVGTDAELALQLDRVSAFVLPGALITVRMTDGFDLAPVLERWEEEITAGTGSGGLAYSLLDYLVDDYFDALQELEDRIQQLDDTLFAPSPRTDELQQQVHRLRNALAGLRRIVLPMREVVTSLGRFEVQVGREVERTLEGYYADLYDHVIRATEWTEYLRDLLGSVFETTLAQREERLNEIMKKLAAWAAIVAVPTAVTGWFGQNLPYPGYGTPSGLVMSIILIVVLGAGLFVIFRKSDWI
ncbi:MAG: magnesium transporter CorA family protein [Propionicimonas sp.]|uniref:magnesium transporter CorA family protein n=1 Tax=Propionicimonas sp. TaxID=1955623 RepID=UPI002B1F645C|nr:magnesium transporter CorA family protein [Propionicimonas sp.]MEA4943501.1 magnesium transporter CorA family protein [Propionicimonas sp.]